MKFSVLLLVLLCAPGAPAWAQNTITVRVTDANKAPLAASTVALRIWGEQPYREESLQTGADGTLKFELKQPLDPKKTVGSVTVYAQGFALQSRAIDAANLDLALSPGATWRGTVADETGKIVSGAKIVIGVMREKGASRENYIVPVGKELTTAYSAISGADGAFEIAGLPVGGSFSYTASAPGWAATTGDDLSAEKPANIVLKPGALLSGQLLGLDGKPIPDTRIYAVSTARFSGGGYGEAQTDKDGKFLIDSLSAGTYNVGADVPDTADYLVPTHDNLLAETGKTGAVPTLQAVAGLVAKGVVRDAETQKPLAGAQIAGIFGPDGGGNNRGESQLTGADGRFSVRVMPGQNTFQVYQKPDAYISSGIQQTLIVDEKTPDIVFDLPRQPVVSGTILDEKNQPVQMKLRVWGGFQETIESDAQGQWSFQPESLATLNLAGGDTENGYYEISSGANIEVAAKGPHIIKVRLMPWQKLKGRVVAPDGTPRANIAVKADFYFSTGDNGLLDGSDSATTGADGNYQFDKIRGGEKPGEMARGLKITSNADGLSFVGGGDISPDGTNWNASDIVLTALDRQIEGTTSAGARVVAGQQETKADANGHFAFKDLPRGEIPIYAALDGKFGSAVAIDNALIQIELAPMAAQGTDIELGRDAWREVVNESQGKDFYARDWVIGRLNAVDGETFAALQQAAQEPPTTNHDYSLLAQLLKWAPKLPPENRAAQIESVARGIQDPETRLSAWLDAAIAVGDDPKVNERALTVADELLARAATDADSREWNLYRVAVVTERAQGAAAGSAALDKAIAVTLKSHGPKNYTQNGYYTTGRDGTLASAAEVVAKGSAQLLGHLLNNISPDAGDDVSALNKAIPVVAQTRGVEAALPLLEKLLNTPAIEAPAGGFQSASNQPQWAYDNAARRIVPLLAATSPARALELARTISDKGDLGRALAGIAPFESPAVAAKLWREAVKTGDLKDAPRFAARAFDSDAKLGVELFALARVRGANAENYESSRFWSSYAFYLARADAAMARLELEREWSARLASNEGQNLAPVARAMSAADGSRALEMARQIPAGKDNFWSLEARRKIAQYLIADNATRRDWPFDRWGATDTWSPGDEEW